MRLYSLNKGTAFVFKRAVPKLTERAAEHDRDQHWRITVMLRSFFLLRRCTAARHGLASANLCASALRRQTPLL